MAIKRFWINMFDTGVACKELKLESYSFKYVLFKYCGMHADKQYQLADWRIRPLTDNMMKYAREDTHYLLYIYDRLKKDMNEEQMIKTFQNSQQVTKILYQRPVLLDEQYYSIVNAQIGMYSEIKIQKLRDLLQLRDEIARNEDESRAYVLPNELLFRLIENNPTTESQMLMNFPKLSNPFRKYIQDAIRIFNKQESVKVQQIVQFNQDVSIQQFEFNDDYKIQMKQYPIKINDHDTCHIFKNKENNNNQNQILYNSFTEYLIEKYPLLKKSHKFFEQKQQSYLQVEEQQQKQNMEIEQIDYIQLPTIKGEKQVVPQKIKQYEIPQSLNDQYQTSFVQKRKNKSPSMNVQKKVKNSFEPIQEKEVDEQAEEFNKKCNQVKKNLQSGKVIDKKSDPFQLLLAKKEKKENKKKRTLFGK